MVQTTKLDMSNVESNGNAVRVHEKSHFYDREREVLFLNRRLWI